MRVFLRQLRPALLVLIVFTAVCGLAYPLLAVGVGQVAFNAEVNGSLIRRDGVVVGSALLGQGFTDAGYFHSRPSAVAYDGAGSGASNLGPLNSDLLDAVQVRVAAYRTENGLAPDQDVPVDAVTSSGSGLDPDISVANARLQASRVATARGMTVAEVDALVDEHVDGRALGVLGVPGVNVLELQPDARHGRMRT